MRALKCGVRSTSWMKIGCAATDPGAVTLPFTRSQHEGAKDKASKVQRLKKPRLRNEAKQSRANATANITGSAANAEKNRQRSQRKGTPRDDSAPPFSSAGRSAAILDTIYPGPEPRRSLPLAPRISTSKDFFDDLFSRPRSNRRWASVLPSGFWRSRRCSSWEKVSTFADLSGEDRERVYNRLARAHLRRAVARDRAQSHCHSLLRRCPRFVPHRSTRTVPAGLRH